MVKRIWAAWLLTVLVLAGCGGGQDAVLPQPQGAVASTALGTPQAATAPPGAQITPAQLMDWAEKTYPALFPVAGKTDGTSAPYTYRYYPATRNYIGVSTGAAAVDIYLYGEISGWSIARVGALADFICTVSPDACEIRRLSVSQFGSGTIQMPNGQAFCAAGERDCTREYPAGASVTLTAAASSGWRLHHWSGCDTVNTTSCTVAVGADRTVHPVFERTTPLTLKPDAVQLQSTTMSQLISNQGGVLIFSNAASQIAGLTAGKVIYSTVGQGLLRRVTNVIALPGGNYIVDTTDAALTDLIAHGTLILDGRAASPQRAALPPQFAGAQTELSLTSPNGLDGVSGKLALDLQPEINWDFDSDGFTEFKFMVNPNLSLTELQFRLKEGLFDREKNFPILPPTTFVVGPVVVTLGTDVVGRAQASVKAGVEFSAQLVASGALGTRYLRSTGWRGVGDINLTGRFTPGPQRAQASGELDLSLSVKPGLKFYGVAGPALALGGFVKAEASDTVSAQEACLRWNVVGGFRARAEGEVKVLTRLLARYETNLVELSRRLVDSSAGRCEDREPPMAPTNLVASATSPTQMGVTWTAARDNIGATEYALFRDGTSLGKVSGTTFIDTHVQPDTQYCYTLVAYDKAGNRSPETTAACGRTPKRDTEPPGATGGLTATPVSTTSIQLSWGAAAGATAYVIAQDDRVIEQVAAPATGTRIVKLQPGTRYCFAAAAIDGAGNFGAASTSVCATTLTAAAWTMKIKCDAQSEYVVENDVDLDVANDSSVSVVGNAIDYGGTPMAYQLFGTYSTAAATLSGSINWTFSGSSGVRRDEFDVRFAGADTGDVTMRQVQVTGCTADIRFIRKGTPAAAPMAATAAGRPSAGPALLQR